MHRIAHTLALTSALVCAPALAQDLTVAALKAFTAKIDAASAACDPDTIVEHISALAVLSITKNENGTMRVLRLNKAQYGQLMAITCSAATDYRYTRTNEQVSIDGDQAIVTADIAETMTVQGRELETRVREKATIESIDGKLMLTQLVHNQVP